MKAIPNINGLTPDESRIAIASLCAIANGSWFDIPNWEGDAELKTIVGFVRGELLSIHAQIQSGHALDLAINLAINNCLLNLLEYGGEMFRAEIPRWVAASVEDVEALYEKWRRLFG